MWELHFKKIYVFIHFREGKGEEREVDTAVMRENH